MKTDDELDSIWRLLAAAILRYYGAEVESALNMQKVSP